MVGGKVMSVWICAEIGINHSGEMTDAMLLIEAAAAAGADAVKTQSFAVERLYALPEPPICETLRRCALSVHDHLYLKALVEGEGMEYLSTPFDLESLRMLVEEVKVKRLKIGSGCLTDHRLLRAAAETGLPLIVSCGMSTRRQIDAAIYALRGPSQATLLECVSSYPAPPEETNLRWLPAMGAPWGLSHHGPGIGLPVAAVALGARVIEVHITTSRSNEGPDHAASMEPPEFRQMVTEIRRVEAAMGPGGKRVQPSEWPTIPRARKMLATSRPVKQGEEWTEDNLTCLRAPGEWPPVGQSDWKCLGLEADWYFDILGQTAQQDYGERVPLARVEKEFP
jgi:sialic acid synthase SpsE